MEYVIFLQIIDLVPYAVMQAFNLDFNLRAHMKIHSQEHYHVCPYPDCGKRYTQECKLKSHIKAHHEKVVSITLMMIIIKVFDTTLYITCCFGHSLYSYMYGLNFETNPSYVLGKLFYLLLQARKHIGL